MELTTTDRMVLAKDEHIAASSSDMMLAKLSAARLMLSEAMGIKETKRIADLAAAAEIYAQRQHMSAEVEMTARSLKLDAIRKLGEVLKMSPKHKGGNRYGKGPIPSLANMGITDSVARTAYRLYEMPIKEFEKLRESTRGIETYIRGETRRINRRRAVTGGRLLSFPLPGGKLLRDSSKADIRKAAESLYKTAETMAQEARWLAAVAGEVPEEATRVELTEDRLQTLWAKAVRNLKHSPSAAPGQGEKK